MSRQKIYILAAGFIILIGLSALLVVMDREQQVIQTEDVSPAEETEPSTEEDPGSTAGAQNGGDMDIEGGTNEGSFDAGDPSELREQAEETLAEFTPSEEEAFSRASFEEHAYVYTLFQQQGEDYAVEEENTVSSAEWIAAELDAWRAFAEEDYGFSYSRENFDAYMSEQEEQVLQEDAELQVLLDVLESENPELAAQQLEFQYAKSFIWQQIREEAAAEADVNPSSTQEWNQLYFEVEQNVFEQLQENYPELNSSADGPE